MQLFTSYYYQLRFFPENLIALNTTVWPPKYVTVGEKDKRNVLLIDCPPLKPGATCEGLCRGACNPKHPDDCEFLQAYYNQLKQIDFKNFMRKLEHLKSLIEKQEHLTNVNFAFIVFESPANPCSERVIIQHWLKENGVDAVEWHT